MPLLSPAERALARAISQLAHCNPFLPERIEREREVLGPDFVPGGAVWSVHAGVDVQNPNVPKVAERAMALVSKLRERLRQARRASEEESLLYEDLVLYVLYSRHEDDFYNLITGATQAHARPARVEFYREFVSAADEFRNVPGVSLPAREDLPHLFAAFFQVRRAFHHAFRGIIGTSMPAARLRAAVWESIFTHDMRRYRRSLHERMADITTLITGPSGTGKELVASAIGLSRYIPFNPKTETFSEDFTGSFHALNISALPTTLVESELFGHRRGAFTGALEDRAGWLEVCGPFGTVFLDEIGDLEPSVQVKLLRVLQSRAFQQLGDTKSRHFRGKIIAATNRDLATEIRAGRFREDLYYRLCSDLIATPSLYEQLADSPGELRNLILFVAQRVAGPDEAEPLADEAGAWIEENLGTDYRWPGNFRELEQCVRNMLIRKRYRPRAISTRGPLEELTEAVAAGTLTADELLSRYCTLVFAKTGSYQETARRLGIDRRTVRSRVNLTQLDALRRGKTGG